VEIQAVSSIIDHLEIVLMWKSLGLLQKCEPETPVGDCSEPRPEPRPEPQPLPLPLPESEEDEALKQAVIRMLRQDSPAGTSNNAN